MFESILTWISIIISIIGLGISFWSFKNTRDKYYNDFIDKRKKKSR